MAGFKLLKDVSNNFETELRRISTELFSAKIGTSFEDEISQKMRDVSLFTSKLRLLKAKPIAVSPQVTEQEKNDTTTLKNYEEIAMSKVLEQQIVKSLTQAHAVRGLILTSDKNLEPDMIERKEKIMSAMQTYNQVESQLRDLDKLLKERQEQLAIMQEQWDKELGELRNMEQTKKTDEEMDNEGPYDKKLRTLVDKMELMRWLTTRLVVNRADGYDWLSDPHNRLGALMMARTSYTVDMFTEG